MFSFLSGTSICTEKQVKFETKVLRNLYALPDRKHEAVCSAHNEIPPRKLQNTCTILDNGNNTLQNNAPDAEIGNQEQNAVEDVTPKKKRSWRNILSKLFTSCYKATNDAG